MPNNLQTTSPEPSSEPNAPEQFKFVYLVLDEDGGIDLLPEDFDINKINAPKYGSLRVHYRKRAFLEGFSVSGKMIDGVNKANIAYSTAASWRRQDEQFSKEFEFVRASIVDVLEDVAFSRAIASYKSDNLLMFLLRGHAPERYAQGNKLSFSTKDKEGNEVSLTWSDVVMASE